MLLDPATIRAERARRNLLSFATLTMPEYIPGWHHRLLCSHLDRFAAGHIRRLLVCMPPRHGKSELVSRRLPAYLLGLRPDASIIACSYSADLASRMNRDVQRIIDSPAYASIFPGTALSGSNSRTQARGFLRNNDLFEVVGKKGSYRSAGVGGGITGMGFDFGIIDDPIKNREEADSPTMREAVWEWYTSTFYSRRSSAAGILLTLTRWNEDDLAGRLLKLMEDDPKADRWTVLRLPAVAGDERHPDDPRQPGAALWPERFPLEELERTKANSAYEWAALYQQDPRPEGGTEWPESYFGKDIWFDDWPQTNVAVKTIALDPSKGKDAKHGDYSAYVMLARTSDGMLWCEGDLSNQRTSERIIEDGIEHQRVFQADAFVVEANVFQELLATQIAQVSRQRGIMVPVVPIVNTTKKEVRIRRLGPHLARRGIRFRNTPGTRLLVKQLRDFPVGEHDDGPDALEMALRQMILTYNGRNRRGPERLRAT